MKMNAELSCVIKEFASPSMEIRSWKGMTFASSWSLLENGNEKTVGGNRCQMNQQSSGKPLETRLRVCVILKSGKEKWWNILFNKSWLLTTAWLGDAPAQHLQFMYLNFLARSSDSRKQTRNDYMQTQDVFWHVLKLKCWLVCMCGNKAIIHMQAYKTRAACLHVLHEGKVKH